MNARARQLLEEAHQAYLKRDEWQRRGYELEQRAMELLNGKRVVIVMPVISPVPVEMEERRIGEANAS